MNNFLRSFKWAQLEISRIKIGWDRFFQLQPLFSPNPQCMQQKFPFLEQVGATKKLLLNNFLSSFKWSKLMFYRISMAINRSNPLQHLFHQCPQYEHQKEFSLLSMVDKATSNFRVGMLILCHSLYFFTRFCANLFQIWSQICYWICGQIFEWAANLGTYQNSNYVWMKFFFLNLSFFKFQIEDIP